MISAFGVEHSGISKMSDTELRHRKRVQAGLSTAGAVVGLSALGAKGVKVGTGKYLKPAAKAAKVNTKIDSGVNNALVAGGGIGGAAGLNSASISRKEAGKKNIHKVDGNRRIGAGAGIAAGGAGTRYHYGQKSRKLREAAKPGGKIWEHAEAADLAHQPWEKAAQVHHIDQVQTFLREGRKALPRIKAGRKLGAVAAVGGGIIAASGAHKKFSKGFEAQTVANQHKAKHKITVTVPKLGPKGRRHVALATGTGTLAGAGIAAGESKKKLAIGLISAGSALSAYAASEPGEKRMSKSAFGVEHEISKSRKLSSAEVATGTGTGTGVGAGAGYAVNQARKKNLRVKALANASTANIHRNRGHATKLNNPDISRTHFTLGGIDSAKADQLMTRAHSGPRKIALVGGGAVLGAVAGVNTKKKFSKAFDPEARRHTQLGTAAGVAGTVSVASGVGAARSAKKARGHYRAASGANQATKTRLLEGLNLKGAAQVQHAQKTAVNHGEMLRHIKAGNTAAHRARGKTGVALGTAAAAGALVHHSNNGAANYVGPYQPKAKYAQGAKRTVGRIKSKLS